MDHQLHAQPLTPLERLQVRDALQDRWREQVRQITLLSLARYERDDPDGSAPVATPTQGPSLDASIDRARARLEALEQALRRLDNRSYGACRRCGEPIAFLRLAETPDATVCGRCSREVAAPSGPDDLSVA
jgi:RNA polymerase-binding transcription factor DksA